METITIQRELTFSVRETLRVSTSSSTSGSTRGNTPNSRLSDDECWRAVVKRDADFDGVFYTCVKTTGIYCRPSCKARAPLRQNVVFAPSTEAARQAGFRACLRCKPDAVEVAESDRVKLVQRVCRELEAAKDENVSLDALAEQFHVNATHLQRVFKSVMGISPKQYARSLRDQHFKSLVKSGLPVTEAMYEAGYGSSSRLYEQSSERFGMSPASYKRGGAGMTIHYVVAPCSLGCIIVAATEKGICSVQLADTREELERALKSEFPAATIVDAGEADERLADWLHTLTRHIEGQQHDVSALVAALDLHATAFQLRVWEELRRIPYGETRSYSDVAAALGKPSAVRAVASACAANPVALITPCHRVLRAGGELSGYRWGVERKREILSREWQGELHGQTHNQAHGQAHSQARNLAHRQAQAEFFSAEA